MTLMAFYDCGRTLHPKCTGAKVAPDYSSYESHFQFMGALAPVFTG